MFLIPNSVKYNSVQLKNEFNYELIEKVNLLFEIERQKLKHFLRFLLVSLAK